MGSGGPPPATGKRQELSLERVADLDAFVRLTGVEIVRVQGLAAKFLRTAEDHRSPEGRSGLLVDADGSEDVTRGGCVGVPVSQISDNPGGGRGLERLGDLPRRGDKELLQYLNAEAALAGIPQLLDQGPGACMPVSGRDVMGIDEHVGVDEPAVSAHASRPVTG